MSREHLIFNMENPITGKGGIYIESGPRSQNQQFQYASFHGCLLNVTPILQHGIWQWNAVKPPDLANKPHCTLQWRLNGRDGISNHQPHACSLNRLFRRNSKKTSKLNVIMNCFCHGNYSFQAHPFRDWFELFGRVSSMTIIGCTCYCTFHDTSYFSAIYPRLTYF